MMNDNNRSTPEISPIDVNTTETSSSQSRSLNEHSRRKKITWILVCSIVATLVIVTITISAILIVIKKANVIKASTIETSTTKLITDETIQTTMKTTTKEHFVHNNININTKWKSAAVTVAGGNGRGYGMNQLDRPWGIYVDDNQQVIYITETNNARVVKWKYNAESGEIVAGGNGPGKRVKQLDHPTDVLVDTKDNSLIICDQANRRVVLWSHRNHTRQRVIISNILCYGLAMDDDGNLYVSNNANHEVRRWRPKDRYGTIVAGGNRQGNRLNQLYYPTYIFVDHDQTVYVSDSKNHRVMKWMKNAIEGIIVAGGNELGTTLAQLDDPKGVIVDHLDNVYVVDSQNRRIMRWSTGAKEGTILVNGNGTGQEPNYWQGAGDLSFDREGNLYLVDTHNHRVLKYAIHLN